MRYLLRLTPEKLLPALAAITLLFSSPSFAANDIFDPDAEYSAIRVIKTDKGEMTMRVSHTGEKERLVIESEGQSMTMITRLDKQVTWILMPEEKMYMEIPLEQTSDQMEEMGFGTEADLRLDKEIPQDFKKVGTETIAGLKTTKYKGKLRDEEGNEEGTATYWVTDSGIMAKMIYEGTDQETGEPQKVTMELRELDVSKQPAKLFELPAGYKPMELNFGSIMGSMFKPNKGRKGSSSPAAQRETAATEEDEEPGIVSDIAKEAEDEAKSSVTDEVKRSVRDAVRGFFHR